MKSLKLHRNYFGGIIIILFVPFQYCLAPWNITALLAVFKME